MQINGFTPQQSFCAKDTQVNKLLMEHLPTVRSISGSLSRGAISNEDAFQEGCLGGLEKLQRSCLEGGDPVSGFALRVRGKIIDLARENIEQLTGATRDAQRFLQELDRQRQNFINTNMRVPTSEELSELMGVDVDKLIYRQSLAKPQPSVDNINDVTGKPFKECIPDNNPVDVIESIHQGRLVGEINLALARLSDRDAEILRLYFGNDEIKLKEIGNKFGVSEPRICQIIQESLAKLRKNSGNRLAKFI